SQVITCNTSSVTINNVPVGNNQEFVIEYLGTEKQHWKEDFGAGTPIATTGQGVIASSYTFNPTNIINDRDYSIAQPDVFRHSDPAAWHTPPADHSGLANGRYLGINLGSIQGTGNIYTRQIQNVVPNEKIKVSFARFNLLKRAGDQYRIKLSVYNNASLTGTPVYESTEISDPIVATGEYWKVFESPAFDAGNNTELYFVISSHNAGTNGNDILIDDIQVFRERVCAKEVRIPISIVGDTTPPTLTVPAELTIVCSSATATTAIDNWLAQATATDTCNVTVTNNYNTVKPADLCSVGVVTVTFTATDEAGNVVTRTSTIRLTSYPIDAVDNTFPSVNGNTGGTAGNVLDN
ncbi:MAG: HYR domain-containing protein, partial [Capnocytophaga sp.]|nr:HYR domain-containing protein [Capnocytophaga sp.]